MSSLFLLLRLLKKQFFHRALKVMKKKPEKDAKKEKEEKKEKEKAKGDSSKEEEKKGKKEKEKKKETEVAEVKKEKSVRIFYLFQDCGPNLVSIEYLSSVIRMRVLGRPKRRRT